MEVLGIENAVNCDTEVPLKPSQISTYTAMENFDNIYIFEDFISQDGRQIISNLGVQCIVDPGLDSKVLHDTDLD